MDPLAALVVVAALVAACTLLGLLGRARSRRPRTTRATGAVAAAEIGLARLGATASVVQFSTEYCSRCPGVRRMLGHLVDERGPDIAYADVDLTRLPAVAERFRVLQTPTVLVLDPAGAERARLTGAVPAHLVRTALDSLGRTDRAAHP